MTDVLGAVVRLEPDWQALPSDVPTGDAHAAAAVPGENRRKRIADIAAARFVLEHLGADTSMARVATPPRGRQWLTLGLVSAAAAIVAALAMLAFYSPRTAPQPVVRTVIPTSGSTALTLSGVWPDLAMTPDGSRVVYPGDNQLLVRTLDQLEPVVLTRGVHRSPFISPDGQWVGFFERDAIRKVAITGGPPELVASLEGDPGGANMWGSDGTIIFNRCAGDRPAACTSVRRHAD